MGMGADERMNAEGATQRVVPVEAKAQVVEALRHIALSNEGNRERITEDKVIPGTCPLLALRVQPFACPPRAHALVSVAGLRGRVCSTRSSCEADDEDAGHR